MSRPYIVGSLTTNFVNSTGGLTVTTPSGPYNVGDWIVFSICSQASTDVADYTLDTDVARIGIPWATSAAIRASGWYRYVVTDPGSVPASFAFGRSAGGARQNIAAALIRCDAGTITLAGYSATQSTTVSPVTVDAVDITQDNALLLALAFGQWASPNASLTPALTGGSTLILDLQNPSNSSGISRTAQALYTYDKNNGIAGPYTASWSGTPAQATGHMIALSDGSGGPVDHTIDSWFTGANFPAIAHRGAPDGTTRSEFSFDTYDLAIGTYGFTAIEISVHRTSDGQWVCNHDATTNAQYTTSATISAQTLATLQTYQRRYGVTTEPIRTLQEVMTRYQNYVMFIENKTYANDSEFFAIVNALDPSRTHVVIKATGDATSLFALAKSHGYTTWGYYFGTAGAATLPTEWDSNQDWVGLSSGPSNTPTAQTWFDWCLTRGIPIVGHVVDDTADWTSMYTQGASMGMVNDPTTVPLAGASRSGSGPSNAWACVAAQMVLE